MIWQVNLPFKDEAEKEGLLARLSLSKTTGILEKDDELVAFFDQEAELENFTQLLKDSSFFTRRIKENINWSIKWQSFHKAIRIKPFLILTPFLEKKVKATSPYRYKVIINPSFAFGTGSHPTTKMCIKYLIRYVKKGDAILDMGTGSGILAIVSEKLGAGSIVGIDIDEIALKEAEKNLKRNHCKKIDLLNSLSPVTENAFDIIVCNILLKDILNLKDNLIKVSKKKGRLILSGLLREQKDEVISCYSSHFKYKNSIQMKDKSFDWIALNFEKI